MPRSDLIKFALVAGISIGCAAAAFLIDARGAPYLDRCETSGGQPVFANGKWECVK